MKWLKNLISTQREFTGNFIETGDDLLSLAASNQVVAAELSNFTKKVQAGEYSKERTAELSSNALSGYGISVSKAAFLDTLE